MSPPEHVIPVDGSIKPTGQIRMEGNVYLAILLRGCNATRV